MQKCPVLIEGHPLLPAGSCQECEDFVPDLLNISFFLPFPFYYHKLGSACPAVEERSGGRITDVISSFSVNCLLSQVSVQINPVMTLVITCPTTPHHPLMISILLMTFPIFFSSQI